MSCRKAVNGGKAFRDPRPFVQQLRRLVKWFGETKLIKTGFATTTIGYSLLAWTRTLPQLLAASTVNSYGMGVLRPSLTSLITQQAGKREQGVVLGLTQSIMSISQIVAPVIAGALIQREMLAGWALGIGGVALLGLITSVVRPAPAFRPDSTAAA